MTMIMSSIESTATMGSDNLPTRAPGAEMSVPLRLASASPDSMAWCYAKDQLDEWGKDPERLRDEGFEPPSRPLIERAFRLAEAMREERRPGPLRVIPDGEGGIVFERSDGNRFRTIELRADRSIVETLFRDSKLVWQQRHMP